MIDPFLIRALTPVVDAFERLGVRYHIGGSLAGMAYGHLRTTRDVDVVAGLRQEHVRPLVELLGDDYYADEDMIREAVEERSSFNLIHQGTVFKVDVFVQGEGPYDNEEAQRAQKRPLSRESGAPVLFVASPEDTILRKLLWYQMGGGVSDRQWGDILGVLKAQSHALDLDYMRRWAGKLGVADLLGRALDDAGLTP